VLSRAVPLAQPFSTERRLPIRNRVSRSQQSPWWTGYPGGIGGRRPPACRNATAKRLEGRLHHVGAFVPAPRARHVVFRVVGTRGRLLGEVGWRSPRIGHNRRSGPPRTRETGARDVMSGALAPPVHIQYPALPKRVIPERVAAPSSIAWPKAMPVFLQEWSGRWGVALFSFTFEIEPAVTGHVVEPMVEESDAAWWLCPEPADRATATDGFRSHVVLREMSAVADSRSAAPSTRRVSGSPRTARRAPAGGPGARPRRRQVYPRHAAPEGARLPIALAKRAAPPVQARWFEART